jgi:hypothetical protein
MGPISINHGSINGRVLPNRSSFRPTLDAQLAVFASPLSGYDGGVCGGDGGGVRMSL